MTYHDHPSPPQFKSDDGKWLPPTVTGGSAGLNNAMFFPCPTCGAVVLDVAFSSANRERHQEWHANGN